jgi:hypothetical protein
MVSDDGSWYRLIISKSRLLNRQPSGQDFELKEGFL